MAGRRGILLWGGLLLAALLYLFISLGLWQWHKYQHKTGQQADLDARSRGALVSLPSEPADPESLRFRHFTLRGEYQPRYQILLDNRVQQQRAGYHVLTPLRLAGSDTHVLVNRGWVPAGAEHHQLPPAPVPTGEVELSGVAVVPPGRFFTLAATESSQWESVWQNPDLARYRQQSGLQLQPVILQLDPEVAGGFVRDWPRPDDRAEKHLSYALQWFGFAASSVGIWAWFLFRRP